MSAFSEPVVQDATLDWVNGLGHAVTRGLDVTPGRLAPQLNDGMTYPPSCFNVSQARIESKWREA